MVRHDAGSGRRGAAAGSVGAHAALALAALVALPAAAVALDCRTAADQTSMSECASRDFATADTRLNADYRQIAARLKPDPDAANRLVAAQKAWIAFRDAECAFATADSVGGSVGPMVEAQCRARLTRKRVEDFAAYLACHEGDLACPVPP